MVELRWRSLEIEGALSDGEFHVQEIAVAPLREFGALTSSPITNIIRTLNGV